MHCDTMMIFLGKVFFYNQFTPDISLLALFDECKYLSNQS